MDLVIFTAGMLPGYWAGEWLEGRINRRGDPMVAVAVGPMCGFLTGGLLMVTVMALR